MTDIRLKNITKVYPSPSGPVTAVDDVSLKIEPGELYFLLGPSGCGKTTLLRIIAGLVAPDSGRVLFGGRDVSNLSVERRGTAMVFQNYALWPHMTVFQNVEFGPRMQGMGRRRRRKLAEENLALVEMSGLGRRKPSQLSGGQQQRVAVARALAARPNFLLLDEPLSNLDARLRLHMRGELRRLVKSAGSTAVYVTHDQKEALSMADRVAVMNAGRIVQVGMAEEIYNHPATHFVADFLGEANFIAGRVIAGGRVETAAGVLLTAAEACPPAGSAVTCCVRPERIGVFPAGSAPPDASGASLPATVESHTYLGELRQYVCRLGGVAWKVSVLADRGLALPPGAAVVLRVARQDVAIIPGE
jgi:iron(III) transport system ATP-binding protein